MSPESEPAHPDLARLTGPDRRSPGLGLVPALLALPLIVGLVAMWPRSAPPSIDMELLGVVNQVYRAQVDQVTQGACSYSVDRECINVTFRLLEGPRPGTVVLQQFEELPSTPRFTAGATVVMTYQPEAPATVQYQYADRERRSVLLWVALAFGVAVVGLGRLRGLAALGGLVASLFVLIAFIVPAMLAGESPILVAAVGAGTIGFLALYLAHGWTPLTHVALIGTMSALALTVLLSWVTVTLAQLTGFAAEESLYLTVVGEFDVRGLLLAGIVLGALGALDDVTVTQASAVWEIRAANPGLGPAALFSAGLRVGRDHIASTVNTLLLAYAGAAMPLMLLFALSRQDLGVIANSEVVATEIIRTLVGSIGLVTAVPITTWLAARVAHAGGSIGHVHGG